MLLGCAVAGSTLLAPPVRAHLGTPYGDTARALVEAEAVLVVRAREETRDTGEGATTPVDVVAVLAGRAPARLDLRQPPPHLHRHRRGAVFVAPVGPASRAQGDLAGSEVRPYLLDAATAIPAEGEPVAVLKAVVAGWRRLRKPTPLGLRVRHALDVLPDAGRTTLGRRAALEVLVTAPEAAREALTEADRARLARTVRSPDAPVAYRLALIRALTLVTDSALDMRLCSALEGAPIDLRGPALDALTARPNACVRAALDRCAADEADPLRQRCATLRGRLP